MTAIIIFTRGYFCYSKVTLVDFGFFCFPIVISHCSISTFQVMVNCEISETQRNAIISALRRGKSYDAISNELHVSKGSISNIAKEVDHHSVLQAGQPKKLNIYDARLVWRRFNAGVYKTGELAARDLSGLGSDICSQTVRNLLKSSKFQFRRKPTALPLTHSSQKALLQFAKKHIGWTEEAWKGVVFSDETKINRLGSDGKQWT